MPMLARGAVSAAWCCRDSGFGTRYPVPGTRGVGAVSVRLSTLASTRAARWTRPHVRLFRFTVPGTRYPVPGRSELLPYGYRCSPRPGRPVGPGHKRTSSGSRVPGPGSRGAGAVAVRLSMLASTRAARWTRPHVRLFRFTVPGTRYPVPGRSELLPYGYRCSPRPGCPVGPGRIITASGTRDPGPGTRGVGAVSVRLSTLASTRTARWTRPQKDLFRVPGPGSRVPSPESRVPNPEPRNTQVLPS